MLISSRKTLAVDKELADKLAEIAKKEGKTIYSLINDLLKAAIRATESIGESCNQIIENYEDLMVAKDIGLILVPLTVADFGFHVAFKDGYQDELIGEWRKWGKWLGSYLKTRFPSQELEAIHRLLKVIFWKDAILDFEPKPENSLDPKEITVRIYGSALKEERTTCISATIEEIFKTIGFNLNNSEILKGICKMDFKKKG